MVGMARTRGPCRGWNHLASWVARMALPRRIRADWPRLAPAGRKRPLLSLVVPLPGLQLWKPQRAWGPRSPRRFRRLLTWVVRWHRSAEEQPWMQTQTRIVAHRSRPEHCQHRAIPSWGIRSLAAGWLGWDGPPWAAKRKQLPHSPCHHQLPECRDMRLATAPGAEKSPDWIHPQPPREVGCAGGEISQ